MCVCVCVRVCVFVCVCVCPCGSDSGPFALFTYLFASSAVFDQQVGVRHCVCIHSPSLTHTHTHTLTQHTQRSQHESSLPLQTEQPPTDSETQCNKQTGTCYPQSRWVQVNLLTESDASARSMITTQLSKHTATTHTVCIHVSV